MSWIIDVGQEARGVIAIGQIATGVVAVGQMATGVIAIGQVARGFVAIGQGSIGLVAVGMGSVGVFHGTAMLGVGGRGLGLVMPVAPYWPKKFVRPDTTSWKRLKEGTVEEGWLRVELEADDHGPLLCHDGKALPVRFDRRMLGAAKRYLPSKGNKLFAKIGRQGKGLVCTDLSFVPRRAHWKKSYWVGTATQLGMLAGVCAAFWLLAGRPVIDTIVGW